MHKRRDASRFEQSAKNRVGRHEDGVRGGSLQRTLPKLEIVLKCDSTGSVEAVTNGILRITVPQIEISIIHSGVGEISKSDVLYAETGSRLIVGFQVHVVPGTEKVLRERHVEVRLYDVIYSLLADIEEIAASIVPHESEEQIIGSARVIALFKGSRKGIIMGCEVSSGFLAVGERFRIISAMGPVYSGVIESIHIGEQAVQRAGPGEKVGVKVKNFTRIRMGDLVESLRPVRQKVRVWQATGEIVRK
ncbi:MAG TPA: hypothetical protein VFG09_15480 [Thermodesulfovibrionales bacterium]|nr:hypothetical protein [Thermodesulfovibrionales bacterium]